MQNLPLSRIAVLALTLGAAGLTAASAQTPPADGTDTPTDTTKHFHHHGHGDPVLTADERAELKKDFQDAMADPDIKTDSDNLKAQEKALHEQAKALHEKIHAAILASDPGAQALFDKLEAAHKDHGDKGGWGGWHHHHGDKPDDATTTGSTTDTTGGQ